ncbi:hypothetical protein K474DRAFT_1752134 [Panus rudis PR-1116 ss-1]|nr:hypothetical protein K474DRAFT_1752134 [Panus rudis PR-1116 ss-1]
MAPSKPSFDWSKQRDYKWSSDEGIKHLRDITQPFLPYTPSEFQLENTARLLLGEDVVCVTATGDGKTALIYLYTIARPGTMSIVISPTNSLEADMVNNLEKLGINALAINSETLAAAKLQCGAPRERERSSLDLNCEQACNYNAKTQY